MKLLGKHEGGVGSAWRGTGPNRHIAMIFNNVMHRGKQEKSIVKKGKDMVANSVWERLAAP
jgi:hypothetical protein